MTSEQLPTPSRAERATWGDIVTIDLELTPEDGFVPEPLFDTSGRVSFILGWGNYLPGLHELISTLQVGDEVRNVSIDGGWGSRNPDLVIDVPKENFAKLSISSSIRVGSQLRLQGGIQVTVVKITDEIITVDANPPLAGSGYNCSVSLVEVHRFPQNKLLYSEQESPRIPESSYEVATFAMGCFWGGELAFLRAKGVVGTKVGYTQGNKHNPSYEDVCSGGTKHREAIMVVYDTQVTTFEELLNIFLERLTDTDTPYYQADNMFAEEDEEDVSSYQYRHGIYFHNKSQRIQAEGCVASNDNKFDVELKEAAAFYDAEEHHQQYLLKGGQSARKGCIEKIRCFG